MGVITVSIWMLAAVGSKYKYQKKMETDSTYTQQIQEEVDKKENAKTVVLEIRDL